MPDELEGFEKVTLELKPEDDGELCATLIRSCEGEKTHQPAVLYLHGFVDYFFQTHLAEAIHEAGFRFYALDLRRHGRSIRERNRQNTAATIDDYFEEISWAVDWISAKHGPLAALAAHSTGALIAALYLSRGKSREKIQSLVLNSPFLQFNLDPFHLVLSRAIAQVGSRFPKLRWPQRIKANYGMTIHESQSGNWNYDLKKKPLQGFPLYAGWFHMIHAAQDEVTMGLSLDLPILSLHSARSHRAKGSSLHRTDFEEDIVLNVEHIRDRSQRLGSQVTITAIEGGIHDLLLSRERARSPAIHAITNFIRRVHQS